MKKFDEIREKLNTEDPKDYFSMLEFILVHQEQQRFYLVVKVKIQKYMFNLILYQMILLKMQDYLQMYGQV